MLQCVILAGGVGSRLRPLTEERPKALLPVLDRPFADWQLRLLAEQGVKRVLFSIGYRGEMIREFVGDGGRWGIQVSYVDEGKDLLGTGGALRLALAAEALEEAFFVLYGDSYLPLDLREIEAAWERTELPALMTVFRNEDRWDRSNAVYSDGRVVRFEKGGSSGGADEMQWIDFGLSALKRDVVAERITPEEVSDLADLMRDLSMEGRLAGFEVSERFYEAGSREGLRDLEYYLSHSGK